MSMRMKWLKASSAAALALGCSDEATVIGPQTPEPEGPATNPAILIGVYVPTPDDRNIYVGAVPEVPNGELDYSSFLEFGSVDVSTYGGFVYVWDREPANLTRFTVNQDLTLSEGPTLSFASYGANGGGGEIVYISPTRAYMLAPSLEVVIVWDPTRMLITGSLPVTPPERAEIVNDTFAHSGRVVGDSVIWQLNSLNMDALVTHRSAAVAIMSATSDEPWQIVEDTRCVATDGGYLDANGDFYLRAGAYWGYFAAFGPDAASNRACVLRVRAGERSFDPDYLRDMRELTGTYINYPWFHVQDDLYLVQSWDPAVPLPAEPGDFWTADLVPRLVNLTTGESQPYPDIDGTKMISSAEYDVDGVRYYEMNPEGFADGAPKSVIAELRPEGVVEKFSLPNLWALARIR